MQLYESLSEDEGDMRDEDQEEPSNPTDTTTAAYVKPGNKRKGTRQKRSKAWNTFDELPIGEDKVVNVRCSKCGYTCIYNSSNGIGNMLKHQKVCLNTGDIRQMILSTTQGSVTVRDTSFDPKIFRDLITNAVVRQNLPLSFVEYEGIRDAFLYANPKATLMLYGEYNEQYPSLVETLKQIFNVYKNRMPTYSVVCEPEPGTSLQMEGSDVMKEFDALDMELNPTLEKTELDRYLEEKRLNKITNIDILEYWNSNQFRFPNLALMARDILSIPISTMASESAFSTGGRILDQYRSCLAHAIVESLICTRDWRFNEKEVLPNYTLEELTQDIIKLSITDDPGPGPSTGPSISQRKTRGKYMPGCLILQQILTLDASVLFLTLARTN
ncbi:hypothetical protein POM88_002776 [Heracleum sosnowskyi]|uniref:HAT C-terminal dimerisation domain-containing protein n=1 Tax=Heracleum sosnowskyi TaxID=360622 RepID=A0AAD8NCB0_9APIA|nr:hypothetical protein POM88_002776 [Heracleum sosnowskyi]